MNLETGVAWQAVESAFKEAVELARKKHNKMAVDEGECFLANLAQDVAVHKNDPARIKAIVTRYEELRQRFMQTYGLDGQDHPRQRTIRPHKPHMY